MGPRVFSVDDLQMPGKQIAPERLLLQWGHADSAWMTHGSLADRCRDWASMGPRFFSVDDFGCRRFTAE